MAKTKKLQGARNDIKPWSVANIPVYEDTTQLTKEELKFRSKREKRARKDEGRKKRAAVKGKIERKITNYTVVRYRPEGYTPLRGLNPVEQVAMTARYMFDKKFREERIRRQQAEKNEQLLQLKIKLKNFITSSLNKVPTKARVILQIDNVYLPVLEDVLKNTLELQFYDIDEIKINPNYRRYVRKIHPLIQFIPLPEYKSHIVKGEAQQ